MSHPINLNESAVVELLDTSISSKKIVKTAVVLVNLGTPKAPTPREVWRFLSQFLFDPCVVDLPKLFRIGLQAILPFRAKKVAKLYQRIWMPEGSPLQVHTERLGLGLQKSLQASFQRDIPVYVAMTYGSPNVASVVKNVIHNKIERLIVLPLFPQYSKSTTRAVWNKLNNAFSEHILIPSFYFIHEYANEEVFINAQALSIDKFWTQNKRSERLLFSFHGIPKRYETLGDTYPKACKRLAREIAKKLKIAENSYEISFQSRFGFAPWVTPYTDQILRDWGRAGIQSVDIVSPSFAVDCLETLEELDIEMRHLFLASGGKKYQYIPALNDSPIHIEALKCLIQKFF